MTSLLKPGEAEALLAAAIRGELPDERGRFGPFGGRYVPETLVPAFETTTGHRLSESTASTGKLYAQIRNGAPYDVLLADDALRPRLLEHAGLAVQGSRMTYAIGRLVLWSREAGFAGDQCRSLLDEDAEGRIAIANPRTAPYGAAAESVLLYLVVFASAATLVLLQFASMRLPAAKVMAYTYLTPTWVIAWEMGRIQSHLLGLGAFAMDVGAMTIFLWTFREREIIYDFIERICGAFANPEELAYGRDGLPAEALLLFGTQDAAMARYQMEQGQNEEQKRIEMHKLNAMVGFAESLSCRRRVLLGYLGESLEHDCGNCDVCLDPPETFDGTEAARKVLSCVYRVRQSFGMKHVVDVLRGADNERVRRFAHDHLSTYGIGMEHSHAEWMSIARQLEEAIANDNIVPMYQSIIDLQSGELVAQEALARLHVGNGTYLEAGKFIEAALHLQMTHKIDHAITKQTILYCSNRVLQGKPPLPHFVNVSADLLRHPDLVEDIFSTALCQCEACGDLIGKEKPLVIEITEQQLLSDVSEAKRILQPFIDFGLRLAVDDFGSGYSSVRYLASMPVDVVKFDISLVQGLQDVSQANMVTHLARMILESGHHLIAEGIEDKGMLESARAAGFARGQGYLLGRPAERATLHQISFDNVAQFPSDRLA